MLNKAGKTVILGTNGNKKTFLKEKIIKLNITNNNFFISKAELEVSGIEGYEKLVCNIKYVYPDTYLISIRNRTGIEAARIFFRNDTVFVNDRINRKLYYGSNDQIMKKYGFNQSVLPLILGDYLTDEKESSGPEICTNGIILKKDKINGLLIDYIVDCGISKVISTSVNEGNPLNIRFLGFMSINDILIPENILIEKIKSREKISIKIDRIEYPWNGTIDFIPDARYEKLPLL